MSKIIVPFERPVNWKNLRQDEAERVIRKRALDTANIIFTDHAYDRVDERDIIQTDVLRILREAMLIPHPNRKNKMDGRPLLKREYAGEEKPQLSRYFSGSPTI